MHGITQSNSLNPSVASDCKWNIGFPVLGNISVAVGLPFAYNDLGIGKEYIESDKILSLLKNTNLLSANIGLNILTIGYRTGDTYYQFTMNEKIAAKVSFSKDPVELLLKGNAPYVGATINANVALNLSLYSEYGLNIAHGFGDDLWLGARAKLMFGKVGASSSGNILSFYTDPLTYALNLKSDLLLNASFPGTVETNPSDESIKRLNSDFAIKQLLFNPMNVGGAIDLGLNKTFENGWKVSASILNIGIINWSKNTHRIYQKSTLNYTGATSGIKNWDDFTDTLTAVADVKYDGEKAFSQWLTPEIMFGISYPVIEYMRVGVTGYAGINSVGNPMAITATVFTDNTSIVYGALSYTVTNTSLTNIGVGLGLRLGAFNIHALTDNIIGVFKPASQRYVTLQFGINFKFGCGEENDSSTKKYKSVPCPSFGHYSSKGLMNSVPCSSGK
jgi:hypothetical protein